MADGEPDAGMGYKQHQDGMDTDEAMVLEGTNSNDKGPSGPMTKQDLTAAHDRYLDSLAERLEATHAADKDAACKLIREQEAQKRQDLEDNFKKQQAEMLAEHKATMAASEAMLARKNADNKQFRYIVRGCKGELASGSVPSQIFQAEPASALAHIYDGAWEYAQDAEGRALVNSNPLHWPLILDWLSFGAIPEQPTKAFISECTYWQLDKLLAAMGAQQDQMHSSLKAAGTEGHELEISKVFEGDMYGFEIKGRFHTFLPRFKNAGKPSVKFQTLGSQWSLVTEPAGIMIYLLEGPELTGKRMMLKLGDRSQINSDVPIQHVYKKGHGGYGFNLADPTPQKLFTSPRYVDLDGSLQLSFTLLFA